MKHPSEMTADEMLTEAQRRDDRRRQGLPLHETEPSADTLKRRDVSETFNKVAKHFGVPPGECEYEFAKDAGRKWRFDYAWPECLVALECEGGVWVGGRHTSGAGFLKDIEKYNAAAVRGWLVLRCTPATLFAEATFKTIKQAIAVREAA